MYYQIKANGEYFDLEIIVESETKLLSELKKLKKIHQNELKRIINKEHTSSYIRRKRKKRAINDINPQFEKLKIQINKI